MKNIIYFLIFVVKSYGHWLHDAPQKLSQSNGEIINLFASGDQYYHRLHDKNDYTVVLNPKDGDFYYARILNGDITPSVHKVGLVNPVLTDLSPGIKISRDEYLEKREYYEQLMSHRNGRDAPTSGTLAQLNVFIKFADDPNFPNLREYYDIPFNSTTEASIRDYFYEVSYGALTVDTYHFPPSILGANTAYTDSQNRGYYSPYSVTNPEGYETDDERTLREHTLLRNAVIAIQNSVPEDLVIDADNDGYVDALSFSIYGNVDGWSDLLWPHRWALYSFDVYINGSRVYDYTFELTESSYFTAGVLCHEFFHVLGAPDLYHYNENGSPDAVGGWDLMESTSNPPQYMGAFMKWKYGDWLPDIPEITSTGNYTLSPLQQQENSAYKVASPNSDTEYYVLEYRVKEGNYDSNTPGSRDGLLVYKINTEAGNGNAQGPPDEVYLYRPGGTLTSQGSFVSAPYNADWSHTEINDFSNPEPFLYNEGLGGQGGLNLLNVGSAGETISFTVSMGEPTIELNQESISFEMNPNDFQTQNVVLSNGGDQETLLMFDISSASLPFENPQGGPDVGGYFWSSSSSDSLLEFTWQDIDTVASQMQFPNNDESPGSVPIGFSFPFFDDQYVECVVNPNGWIGFGQDASTWNNTSLPNDNAPRPAIMGMWDDLNPLNGNSNASAAGNVYYHSDIENETFVVWFNNVVTWQNNAVSGNFDFQIVLHGDGRFEINYNEIVGSAASSTVGFQDVTGNYGTLISYNENFLQNQESIFISKAIQSDWLVVGTQTGEMNGLIPGGQSFNINLMANTNEMDSGNYFSVLTISSDQVEPKSIPIQLQVYGDSSLITIPIVNIDDSGTGIVYLPETVDPRISSVFQKYTHLQLSNESVIPILSQSEVLDSQILHARKVLKEYLTDVPLTYWGNNKNTLKNALSMSNAFLMILNDEDEYNNPNLEILFDYGAKAQDVLATEIFPEGSNFYMNSSRRDATYEKVLHFIHYYGIRNAFPSLQLAIGEATSVAMSNGNYIPLSDLPSEDYDDEYLTLLTEVYFGFWAHDPEEDGWAGSHEYRFINREQIKINDSLGYAIVSQFFGGHFRYNVELPTSFSGEFSLSYDSTLNYTNRSQYLQNVTINGDNNVDIVGNDLNNKVYGNSGENIFIGKGLDDFFDGGDGIDKADFLGDYDEYAILESADWNGQVMSIVDLVSDRDGIDTLVRVEKMDFNGVVYAVGESLSLTTNNFVPDQFKLFPAYPNPFNSSTTIRYDIPKSSSVNIFVIDLLGRKVKTLVIDGNVGVGSYQVKWRGFDDQGNLLPSGIYLIQFVSKDYTNQFKTVMIK